MGALHDGHLSLTEKSVKDNDITVVSIFVNPTQFNNPNDLKTYPRCIEEDLAKLQVFNPDLVFIPEVDEIYPEKDTRVFNFGHLDNVMEGKNRPGHFNGVAQVVSKLFDIVSPDNAYFGQKDFQQVAVIKQMVKDLKLSVNIVPCPIIREKDGLAMSSRSLLLSVDQRKNACKISETLFKACNLAAELSVNELKDWVVDEINKNPYLSVEYFEIVDDTYLKQINSWDEDNVKVGCITVQVGNIRLIDNITF
jgi:pantoate--beta-alanine ligase